MKGLTQCTVVLEFNYQEDPSLSLGTVWLYPGDASEFLENSEDPLEESPGWARIVGPIDYGLAGGIQSALVKFLRESGVSVVDEGIAD